MKFVLGVDEAGRGPLAGPVAVGVVMVPKGFEVAKEFPGVADSKELTEKKREEIFEMLTERAERSEVRFCVKFGSHRSIDQKGISPTVRNCVFRGVRLLAPDPTNIEIYLDGLLRAPRAYKQQTIIDGDALIPIISLASIAAKVVRDRLMKKLALQFPHYGFEQHKGYGTPMHYKKIEEFGPCDIHRISFLHLDLISKEE